MLVHSDAMNSYGIGLKNGYLGQIDLHEAMKYFKKAAEANNISGMYNYAKGLDKGWGG
jgi:TPR repeat protein